MFSKSQEVVKGRDADTCDQRKNARLAKTRLQCTTKSRQLRLEQTRSIVRVLLHVCDE